MPDSSKARPWYPNLRDVAHPEVERTVRLMLDYIYGINNSVLKSDRKTQEQFKGLSGQFGADRVRGELQLGGRAPLSVEGLLGKLAQPQIGGAKVVSVLPPVDDPVMQGGALIVLNPVRTLYYVDDTVLPPVARAIAATGVIQFGLRSAKPAAGNAGYTYFETDTGWTYYDNGTNYLYLAGVDKGTNATRTGLTIGTNDNGALFYATDTQQWWRVASGAWTLVPPQPAKVDTTPVTVNANSTVDQNLMSWAVPSAHLNQTGRTLAGFAAGVYTTQALQTPTMTFKVKLGSTTLLSWTSGITVAAVTDIQWNFDFYCSTASTGATGTLECHGTLRINLGALGTTSVTAYADTNTAASGATNLTGALTLQLTVAFSTQPAADPRNACTERQLAVKIDN